MDNTIGSKITGCVALLPSGETPAQVHQLLESFSVVFAESSCETVPSADFLFQSDPV